VQGISMKEKEMTIICNCVAIKSKRQDLTPFFPIQKKFNLLVVTQERWEREKKLIYTAPLIRELTNFVTFRQYEQYNTHKELQ